MSVLAFDHVAIPVNDVETMLAFYRRLGFTVVGEADWRAGRSPLVAIAFGHNKINFHAPPLWQRPSFTLRAPAAQPGCGDFCFVWDGGLATLQTALAAAGAAVETGPVTRQGGRDAGTASGTSIYTRDPEHNLLEFIVYP
jgi:catechol 2,3-dioxygenase-like lactoylglutathione lyase family enzyme